MACELTQTRLKELLEYDPISGDWTRLITTSSRARRGDRPTRKDSSGYIQFQVDGRLYLSHRLVWLYLYGRWPVEEIDHINGDRSDNRLENLRECTRAQNAQNRKIRADSRSGRAGVYWRRERQKWLASITTAGRTVFLGLFDSKQQAAEAYLQAKAKRHLFYARCSPTDK